MKVSEIILHCSATVESKNFTASDIDKWHKAKGWKKIGYHFVVDLDGTLETGRELFENGAHCIGHNSKAIGICYIGGLDKDGKTPKDTRTCEQKETLCQVVYALMGKYNIPINKVYGHYELTIPYKAKACPCIDMDIFRSELKKMD